MKCADSAITDDFLKVNLILRNKSSTSDNVTYECLLCKSKRIQEAMLPGHVTSVKHYEMVRRREDGIEKYTDTKYHGQCLQYSLEQLLLDRCSPDEFERRVSIVSELEGYIQQQSRTFAELEGVTLDMYGSSAFSAATKESDINCFLRVKEYLLCVKIIVEVVRQYGEIYTEPAILSYNRYPRIKFKHKESDLDILISVHSPKSDNFTELMKRLFACDERAVKLAQLLKIHSQEMNLLDGTFANHMFYVLTVYFCQQTKPPLLPTFINDYEHLMTKSEEEKCKREERELRKGEAKKKSLQQRKPDKTSLSTEEVAIQNFAARLVLENLRSSLFRFAHEHEINVTSTKIDVCIEEAGVEDKIFPLVTEENDPWKGSSSPAPSASEGWADTSRNTENRYSCVAVDWNTVGEDSKMKLADWGQQYLAGIGQECYKWNPENPRELHQLFQEMIRFFAKFTWDSKAISICRSKPDPDKNMAFVEDPFQPSALLYNVSNCGRSKGKKRGAGKNKIFYEMTKHMKTTFELLRHYYEGPHKRDLCLAVANDTPKRLPPYSPFELAIRYQIPAPFSDQHSEPKQEKLPELETMSDQAVQALEKVIAKILYKYQLSDEDFRTRERTFAELGDLVRRHLNPSITPLWFGSSRNGLVLNTSDMDITLDVSKIEPVDPAHILSQLAKVLKENKTFILEEVILQARVPIIKFRRTDNDLSGDIAVANLLAIRNTKMIKSYTEIDDRVRKLGFLVKTIVKECQCADASTGSLSSYAYTMMVIYFLQQVDPPVIPVLQEIKRPSDLRPYTVDTWDTYFYSELNTLPSDWPTDNTDPTALLAVKFFKFYYEEFDYNKTVVAPKQKELLECTEKNWFRPINIEDPFNLDHNLGKQVSTKTLDVIKTVFKQVYLRYTVGPIEKSDLSLRYYLDKQFLLDGKSPPINFICYGCGSRDHYIHDCPNKNRCSNCNDPDHSKSQCPAIKCFNCGGSGHMAGSCPKKKHKNQPRRGSPDKPLPLDYYDRKNWIGAAMKTPEKQIGKHYREFPSPLADQRRALAGRAFRSVSESSHGTDTKLDPRSKKKKQRTSSESKLFGQDFIPLTPCGLLHTQDEILWSDPTQEVAKSNGSHPGNHGNHKVLHVKTSDKQTLSVSAGAGSKLSVKKANPLDKVEPSTTMSFMGGNVVTPMPNHAKETARQKKSKSMVRKDIFGEQKPKPVNKTNKKQTVKVAKVKAPVAPGAGRKATKTEIWEDPGTVTEGSRYGPRREDLEYMGDLAPDFFSGESSNFVHDPDPNDLSEWGDLTPSVEADPIMGAALQREIGPNNSWIDYLSSSPEKPAMKPPSSADQYHSPPKNTASKHLLNQLHSPRNPSRQLMDQLQASPQPKKRPPAKQNAPKGRYQDGSYQDPYLANQHNGNRKKHDSFTSDEGRYSDNHRSERSRNDRNRNDAPNEPYYRNDAPNEPYYRNDAQNEPYYRNGPRDPRYRNEHYERNEGRVPNSFSHVQNNGRQGPSSSQSHCDGYSPPMNNQSPRANARLNEPPRGETRRSEPPNFDALKRRPGRGRGYSKNQENNTRRR